MLLLMATACSSPSSREIGKAQLLTVESGPLEGMRLEIVKGAYLGSEAIEMTESSSRLPLVLATYPELLTSIGPAIDFQPDGAVFDPPAKLSLPFSSKAFDEARSENEVSHLVILSVNDSYVGMDVGPVGYVGMDVGPVGKALSAKDLKGNSFGSISVIANPAGGENDLLAIVSVSHFTTFEVVVKNELVCVQNCADKACGDDGCGGSCGECPGNGSVCTEGQCIAEGRDEITCKTMEACAYKDCWTQINEEGFNLCLEKCMANGSESEKAKFNALNDCFVEKCGDFIEFYECYEEFKWMDALWCPGLYAACICQPNCENKNCGDDGCGGSCGSCLAEFLCNQGQCEAEKF